MKDYYDKDYRVLKSKSYLIWGLVMAALSLIMIVISALSIVHGLSTELVATGFAAAAIWAAASGVCLKVYYKDNHVEIKAKAKEIAETVENTVKK